MSDRELLELAAKAAWYDVVYDSTYLTFFRQNVPGRPIWNPLNDDGDALRLAVKLKLSVNIEERDQHEWSHIVWVGSVFEPLQSDPYAATRRAIVKAAAEIGRGME